MRQFDVYETPGAPMAAPYRIILQHDRTGYGETVIVAPCIIANIAPQNRRLTPNVLIDGIAHVVVVPEMAAVGRATLLGRPVTNLAAHRDEFTAAIDLLFTGY